VCVCVCVAHRYFFSQVIAIMTVSPSVSSVLNNSHEINDHVLLLIYEILQRRHSALLDPGVNNMRITWCAVTLCSSGLTYLTLF
jgi:hypothetical protein